MVLNWLRLFNLPLIFSFFSFTLAVPSHPEAHFSSSNATYFNGATTPGADPYTFFDNQSGLYYAYSTEGMDPGWLFAIYSSPDLISWNKKEGGAMKACKNAGTAEEVGEMCWVSGSDEKGNLIMP